MLSSKTFFLLGLTSLVVGCSTYYKPADTLYWSGKDDIEFFERKRYPDTTFSCVKDNQISYIHGYKLALYDLQTYEVGRDANTIYMTTEKRYTGGHDWTYVFADANHKITSIRSATGFGDIEKEFKCNDFKELSVKEIEQSLANRKTQPRLWRSVASSPNNLNMMWASDKAYKNIKDAEKDAMAQCGNNVKEGCQIMMSYSNTCYAVGAGERKGKWFNSFGFSIDPKESQENAIQSCKDEGGSNCRNVLSEPLCATPCNVLKDNSCYYEQPQLSFPRVNNGQPAPIPADGKISKEFK